MKLILVGVDFPDYANYEHDIEVQPLSNEWSEIREALLTEVEERNEDDRLSKIMAVKGFCKKQIERITERLPWCEESAQYANLYFKFIKD
jgi:DNA polymerase/3'-5' exonuclease PolX